MGFYAPAQLIEDVKRHSVEVREVDVCFSETDCHLESVETEKNVYALRLINGLSQAGASEIVSARKEKSFKDVQDLAARAFLNAADLEALAAADALRGLSGNRHRAFWQISGVEKPLPLFDQLEFQEADVMLRKSGIGENVVADYSSIGLSLKSHPLALLRQKLSTVGIKTSREIWGLSNGTVVKVAGLVVGRQRLGTASGVVFVTLEDEAGYINVVVWPAFAEAQRKALLKLRLLAGWFEYTVTRFSLIMCQSRHHRTVGAPLVGAQKPSNYDALEFKTKGY